MKKVFILCIILLELLFPITSNAAEPMSEYEIKAGFLYKFLFFTEWEEGAFVNNKASIIIGIVGKDPFGKIFNEIEGQTVDGRTLVIKRFDQDVPIEALRQCRVLFISPSLKGKMGDLLESLRGHPVLTVSEVNEFTHLGGMINFVRKKNKVSFEINKAAAERVGIKFRSKLLRVATLVVED